MKTIITKLGENLLPNIELAVGDVGLNALQFNIAEKELSNKYSTLLNCIYRSKTHPFGNGIMLQGKIENDLLLFSVPKQLTIEPVTSMDCVIVLKDNETWEEEMFPFTITIKEEPNNE